MIGISETANHLAMTLGRKCAIVTSSGALCEVYGEQVTRYGVESRHRVGPYSADILRS
jgi:Asp/Glu/hydantoin racemase